MTESVSSLFYGALPSEDRADGNARVHVRVPATSANLGPGYDSFGLALGRYDEVFAELADDIVISVSGVGAESVPRDARHLVVRAVQAGFDAVGEDLPGLRLQCVNTIPHGGGQGSSASAIVAGLLIARGLIADGDSRLSDSRMLELATAMEGHPDNVAPAIFGGLTVSWTRPDGSVEAIRRDVHPDIRLVVFTAEAECSTEMAREMLPATVPHKDAAANAAAAAVLLHSLTLEPKYLLDGTADLLHQSYRAPAMPSSAALVGELRAAGIAAVISGAGPSVLAFTSSDVDPANWRRPGFVTSMLEVDRFGATLNRV